MLDTVQPFGCRRLFSTIGPKRWKSAGHVIGSKRGKKKTSIYRSSGTGQFVVGGKASAKISKIDDMTLSKEMRTTFREFDRKDLSADARRTALTDKCGKKVS